MVTLVFARKGFFIWKIDHLYAKPAQPLTKRLRSLC